MATNWPTSRDTFTNPTSGDTLDSPSHAAQHANINDAVEAMQGHAGLVLVKPTSVTGGTIGTYGAVTIGSAVSSVTVNGAFSSTFDNYFVTLSGGAASTANALNLTLGSTATGYYRGGIFMNFNGTGVNGLSDPNATSFVGAGVGQTTNLSMALQIFMPNATERTLFVSEAMRASAGGLHTFYRGYLDDTTSYTAFTLTTTTGTMTGGTIRVYGYNNG